MKLNEPVIMTLETAYNLGVLDKRFFKSSGHVIQFVGLFEPKDDGKLYGVFKVVGEKKEKAYHFNGVVLVQEVDFISIPAEAKITIEDGDGTSLLPHIIKY